MPTTFHGIPGGGLFNDIYTNHQHHAQTQHTYIPESEAHTPYTLDDDYEIVELDNTPHYAGINWAVHFLLGMMAAFFYTIFIIAPATRQHTFDPLIAFLVLMSPFFVWWLTFHLLKKRWLKKHQPNPNPTRVTVPKKNRTPRRGNTISTAMYPSLYTGKGLVDADTLNQEMVDLYNHMNSTGDVPQWADTDVAGFEKFFGAACEVSTAQALRGIPGVSIYNDIELRNHGKVSANIDHLAYRDGAVAMVDAKWWSTMPTFNSDRAGGIMVAENSPHNRAVSTCVYEASFLPAPPRAIVFSVRGKAAREFQSPKVVERFYKFVPYEDESQGVEEAPCPVIFVANNRVGEVVDVVLSGGGYVGGVYVPSGSSRDVGERELSRLECTEGLVFGR